MRAQVHIWACTAVLHSQEHAQSHTDLHKHHEAKSADPRLQLGMTHGHSSPRHTLSWSQLHSGWGTPHTLVHSSSHTFTRAPAALQSHRHCSALVPSVNLLVRHSHGHHTMGTQQ